jgi:hypothetical protein
MLIVGFGLMLSAITAFLLWNAYLKCRSLWRAHKARQVQQIHRDDRKV